MAVSVIGLPSNRLKAVQRGLITFTGSGTVLTSTASITAVDTTKTVLNMLTNSNAAGGDTYVRLTDSTTITGGESVLTGVLRNISFEVIEVY